MFTSYVSESEAPIGALSLLHRICRERSRKGVSALSGFHTYARRRSYRRRTRQRPCGFRQWRPNGRGLSRGAAPRARKGSRAIARRRPRSPRSGRRYLWRDLVALRRAQATPAAEQPALFTLREDHRPAGECNATERYSEPNLFTALERSR